MDKLTEWQLRRAAEEWRKSAQAQNDPLGANLHCFMRALEAAAPYLQFPLPDPSASLTDTHAGEEMRAINNSAICQWGDGKLCRAVNEALREYVRMRNAKLPKPADFRATIQTVFMSMRATSPKEWYEREWYRRCMDEAEKRLLDAVDQVNNGNS